MLEILDLVRRGTALAIQEAKTKALISCAVTAQLICAFVFAYAKISFSRAATDQHHHRLVGAQQPLLQTEEPKSNFQVCVCVKCKMLWLFHFFVCSLMSPLIRWNIYLQSNDDHLGHVTCK